MALSEELSLQSSLRVVRDGRLCSGGNWKLIPPLGMGWNALDCSVHRGGSVSCRPLITRTYIQAGRT